MLITINSIVSAQLQEVKKEKLESGRYCYSLTKHWALYENQKNNIDLKKSNHDIPPKYIEALHSYLKLKINDDKWPFKHSYYSIGILLNNSGKIIYVDVMSHVNLNAYSNFIEFVDYACRWNQSFEEPISTDPQTLFLIGWSASAFD